jgi:RNA-directed DNA polymerase
MIKASIDLQDLRRSIYVKAKAEPSWRFWGLTSMSARWRPYVQRMRRPGKRRRSGNRRGDVRGRRSAGTEAFLDRIRGELVAHLCRVRPGGTRYRRTRVRSASFRFRLSATAWFKGAQAHY